MSPVYVWQCSTCLAVEERMQSGFEPIRPRCLTCGPYMQPVITAPGVVLNGDGWAKKDRAKEGKK